MIYKWRGEDGTELPLHPDNVAIRAESDRMIAEFKTKEEYGLIFKIATDLYNAGNHAEAGYLANRAARKLPKGWVPPKEVLGLSPMLIEYGVRYGG